MSTLAEETQKPHSKTNLSSSTTKKIKIALVGNPNVGKSVIFNYLTGVYVDVSNYPGTTIEISTSPLLTTNQEKKNLRK